MSKIENLLARIEESLTPPGPDLAEEEKPKPRQPREYQSVDRQKPMDTVPPNFRTSVMTPFVSQSVATISGLPHESVVQFMGMLESGTPWVTAAEKIGISTGQAMDIKSAMVDIGAYKEPGQLAEGLRRYADHLYRMADTVEENDEAIFEATALLRPYEALQEGVMPDVLDADLPADARAIARAYADAIADQLTLPPDDPPVLWGEFGGDESSAFATGTVGGRDIELLVDMANSEAPFLGFTVPEQESSVVMKLTHQNWMGPLTLTMQHVTRALMQPGFDYSELEQMKRLNVTEPPRLGAEG